MTWLTRPFDEQLPLFVDLADVPGAEPIIDEPFGCRRPPDSRV